MRATPSFRALLGRTRSKTLIGVYQLQLELVNVNPADTHWQARVHMWHAERHTKTRAGKRQGSRDVLAPLREQQLPALPGSPVSGCGAAVKGAMVPPASEQALPLQQSWRSWKGNGSSEKK